RPFFYFFSFKNTPTTAIYTLSLHDALPIFFKAILTFPKAVTVGSTSVTLDPKASSPTGSVSSVSVSGRQVTVNLTGVSNGQTLQDRKSTRLNSSHVAISYAVFCLKKKTKTT